MLWNIRTDLSPPYSDFLDHKIIHKGQLTVDTNSFKDENKKLIIKNNTFWSSPSKSIKSSRYCELIKFQTKENENVDEKVSLIYLIVYKIKVNDNIPFFQLQLSSEDISVESFNYNDSPAIKLSKQGVNDSYLILIAHNISVRDKWAQLLTNSSKICPMIRQVSKDSSMSFIFDGFDKCERDTQSFPHHKRTSATTRNSIGRNSIIQNGIEREITTDFTTERLKDDIVKTTITTTTDISSSPDAVEIKDKEDNKTITVANVLTTKEELLPEENDPNDVFISSLICLEFKNSHWFDLLDSFGYFKSYTNKSIANSWFHGETGKKRIFCLITVNSIRGIDIINETFEIKCRVTGFFKIDLEELGLTDIAEKIYNRNSFNNQNVYDPNPEEIDRIREALGGDIPELFINNSLSESPEYLDTIDFGLYGRNRSNSMLSCSRMYQGICRNIYDLHDFPFDVQHLNFNLSIKQIRLWKKYYLTTDCITFHRDSVKMTEWQMIIPSIACNNPLGSNLTVSFKIGRFSGFYIQNIILMKFAVCVIGLVVFFLDSMTYDGAMGRVQTIVSLILTIVALKFTISDKLPTIPYNTLVDNYFNISFATLAVQMFLSIVPCYFNSDEKFNSFINLIVGTVSAIIVITGLAGWFFHASQRISQSNINNGLVITQKIGQRNYFTFRYCSTPYYDNSNIINNNNTNILS